MVYREAVDMYEYCKNLVERVNKTRQAMNV